MKRIIYVFFLALLLSACTTSDNQDPPEIESNFYALTVGNEWVYKNYKYDSSTETYTDTGVIDSINIVNTEVINDNTYFRFRRNTTGNKAGMTFCNSNGVYFELLRDSIGYLIRDDGTIKYANNNFEPRVVSIADWGTVYDELIDAEREITLESGTFESTYTQRFAITSSGEQYPGLDHIYYAEGVGLIYDTSSFVTQDIPSIIRRLDAYNIQ